MPYTPTDWVDGVTPVNAANMDKLEAAVAAAEEKAAKGVGNGYAGLDASGLLPDGQTPARLRALMQATVVPGNDCNNATENGWYLGASGAANIPFSGDWYLEVIAFSSSFCVQFAHGLYVDQTWRRIRNAGAWSAWEKQWQAGTPLIPPVQNGKWLTGTGGAAVWADLPAAFTLPGRLGAAAYPGNIITNWNNAVENGWYSADQATNQPAGLAGLGWALGEVVAWRNDYVRQTVWAMSVSPGGAADAQPRYRRELVAGTWGAWYRVATGPVVYRNSTFVSTSSSAWTGLTATTIPAGLLRSGSTIRFTYAGDFQNVSASPISLRQRLDLGPVVLFDDQWAADLEASLAWRPVRMVFEFQAWGGTSQVFGVGHVSIANFNGSPFSGAGKLPASLAEQGGGADYGRQATIGTASAIAIDMTAANTFILYASLGRTDGAVQMRHLWSTLEIFL